MFGSVHQLIEIQSIKKTIDYIFINVSPANYRCSLRHERDPVLRMRNGVSLLQLVKLYAVRTGRGKIGRMT